MKFFDVEGYETVTRMTIAVSDADFGRVVRAICVQGWHVTVSGRGRIAFEVPGTQDGYDIAFILEQALK